MRICLVVAIWLLSCGLVTGSEPLIPVAVLIDAPNFENGGRESDVSPDSKRIAVIAGEFQRTAFVCETRPGAQRMPLVNNKRSPTSVVFLDNDRVAVGWYPANSALDRERPLEATIHDAKTGQLLETFALTSSKPTSVILAASPDGSRLVTVAEMGEVWDTKTGKRVSVMEFDDMRRGHQPPLSLRVTDDGKRVLIGDSKGSWRIFLLESGRQLRAKRETKVAGHVAFSPDGTRVSVGGATGVAMFDGPSGDPVDAGSIAPLAGEHQTRLTAFSPDGTMLAVQKSQFVTVLDITQAPFKRVSEFEIEDYSINDLRWSRDSKWVLTSGHKLGRSAVWDARTGNPALGQLPHDATIVAIDVLVDGSELLTTDTNGRVLRWSLPAGKVVGKRPEPKPRAATMVIEYAAYLPAADNRVLLLSREATFSVLDRISLEEVGQARPTNRVPLRGYAMSPDGSFMVATSAYSAKTFFQLMLEPPYEAKPLGDKKSLKDMVVLPDRRTLAMREGSIVAIDLWTKRTLRTFNEPFQTTSERSAALAASPDGRWLLGTSAYELKAWDLSVGGDREISWKVRAISARPITFSNSSLLAFMTDATGLHIVELETGQIVTTLGAAGGEVRLVKSLPGTSRIVVVSGSRDVEIYDLADLFRAGETDAIKAKSGDHLWQLMGEADAAVAHAATAELHCRGELVRRSKSLAAEANADRVRKDEITKLIKALDGDDKAVREQAHRRLERMGKTIIPELETAAATARGETADRIESLLRLAGIGSPKARSSDAGLREMRLREALSWSSETARILPPRTYFTPATQPSLEKSPLDFADELPDK